MQYHITLKSSNKKTGPIPVTTTSRDTCPPACPFIGAGCYADLGPLGFHWNQVSDQDHKKAGTLSELCDAIRALPGRQLWRHNQAGDLPGVGNRINYAALKDICNANRGRRGFTYTHKPLTDHNLSVIHEANNSGFIVNVSGNNPAHADTLANQVQGKRIPIVTVLPTDAPNKSTTPAGRKIVACPAEKSDRVSCATCKLCAVRDREYIIGFRAHGTRKRAADTIARGAA